MGGIVKVESFDFPPPAGGACDVLIIAGEHSGDEQAARMVGRALKRNPSLKVCAFGGRALQNAGAELLFDMTGFSIVGLFEVLKHYGFFKKLSEGILNWIIIYKPKAVCFVDYPGLNLHLAAELKKRGISKRGGGNVAALYYISPQIWAWKSARRFKMSDTLDALAVIFPFETACYDDTSLRTSFVGHPFLDESYTLPLSYDKDADILFLPGSRRIAVLRIFPLMLEALTLVKDVSATALYPSAEIKALLEACLQEFPQLKGRVKLLPASAAPFKAKAALMSSGTMSLNCALAGIPSAIVYKANTLTYMLGRLIVKIKYLGISNILLNGSSIPEYIQFAAKPKALAARLEYCIKDPQARKTALEDSEKLKSILSAPAHRDAAGWLLKNIE